MELPDVFGAYVLLKLLDKGATGEVFIARPAQLGRNTPALLVIKRLRPEKAHDTDFIKRFKHEAKVAVAVESPYVAGVYDVGSVSDVLYIAMEYVPGWPMTKLLDDVLEERLIAPVNVVLELIAGALQGLIAIHSVADPQTNEPLDVVHRDISPRNLMVNEDGRAQIIDMGIGRSKARDWETKAGKVLGTPGYMAPEQVTGRPFDQRADLFAMGVVLFELLAGRKLIKIAPVPDMMRATLRMVVPPISSLRRDVPAGLDFVVNKALSKKPEQRFQSANAFLKAVYDVASPAALRGHTAALIERRYGHEAEERRNELQALLARPSASPKLKIPTGPTLTFAQNPRYSPRGEPHHDLNTELSQDDATVLEGLPNVKAQLEKLDKTSPVSAIDPKTGKTGIADAETRLELESRVNLREASKPSPQDTVRLALDSVIPNESTDSGEESSGEEESYESDVLSEPGELGIVPAPTLIVPVGIVRAQGKAEPKAKTLPNARPEPREARKRPMKGATAIFWGVALFVLGVLLGVGSRAAMVGS